jgi:hypothetical protein
MRCCDLDGLQSLLGRVQIAACVAWKTGLAVQALGAQP